MISRITGKLLTIGENEVIIEVNGLGYKVLVPSIVRKSLLQKTVRERQNITLATHYYIDASPHQNVSLPCLVGFNNEIEAEFFVRFITVSGIGPKTALKAFTLPFSVIAKAIEMGDCELLGGLPGIGERKANVIIAELKGKAGKYALIQDEHLESLPTPEEDMEKEAFEILTTQLGHKKVEARKLIKNAMKPRLRPKSTEELIERIYQLHEK